MKLKKGKIAEVLNINLRCRNMKKTNIKLFWQHSQTS